MNADIIICHSSLQPQLPFFATFPLYGSKGYWLNDWLKLWSDFNRDELRHIDVPGQNGTFDISAVAGWSLADCKRLEGGIDILLILRLTCKYLLKHA
ncbi:hypothetical protein C8R48DRAFT_703878 [Suillus tomentosus]|nr:hypothetical protein C8R48DRAFT_703878 [Suillus tomentosus]